MTNNQAERTRALAERRHAEERRAVVRDAVQSVSDRRVAQRRSSIVSFRQADWCRKYDAARMG